MLRKPDFKQEMRTSNSLIVPKNVFKKWIPWAFSTSILLHKIKKLKGDPLEILKRFGRTFHSAKENKRRVPFISSGFVCYVRKGKLHQGGPLH